MKQGAKISLSAAKLVADANNEHRLPNRFRSSAGELDEGLAAACNLSGLRDLNVSGSGVFSENGLKKLTEEIGRSRIAIIDTRKESHGYVNGMAVSWYSLNNYANKELTAEEAAEREARQLELLKKSDNIVFHHWEGKSAELAQPIISGKKKVQSEQELAAEQGLDYLRLHVTDHHGPSYREIDKFVAFAGSLHPNTWLHVHCRGGVGRTTTFMTLYDMLKNAKKAGFCDIVKRQYLLGGKDLASLPVGTYKYAPAVERLKMLRAFYEYCLQYEAGSRVIFSEWAKSCGWPVSHRIQV